MGVASKFCYLAVIPPDNTGERVEDEAVLIVEVPLALCREVQGD
jgi:hypothetical protein